MRRYMSVTCNAPRWKSFEIIVTTTDAAALHSKINKLQPSLFA